MPSKESKKKKSKKLSKKRVVLSPEQRENRRKRKANAKRKKELTRLLRKKSREHGAQPYSHVTYHKGYVYEPIRYTVLTASQMTADRVEMVTSAMKTVTTGPQAFSLPEKPGWACTEVGNSGRVYIVAYCGIEVCLFFKRQLTEIVPEPGEKVPEGVLQDPKEAWQRLDLLGRSAEKSHFVLTQSQRRLEEINRVQSDRMQSLDDLNDELVKKNENQAATIGILKRECEKQEKELRIARRSLQALLPQPGKKHRSKRRETAGNGKRIKHGRGK